MSMIDVREAESTVGGASRRPMGGIDGEVVSVSESSMGGGGNGTGPGSDPGNDDWVIDDDDDTAGSDSDDTVVLSLPGDDQVMVVR